VSINVYWDNAEKTILRQDYDASWSWDEYDESFAEIRRLVDEAQHPVSIIAELARIRMIPPNAIMHGTRAVRELPAEVNLCVVVMPSRLAMTLLQAIQTVTRYEKIRVASSLEDAFRIIAAETHHPNASGNAAPRS
jgi:hypothetical protein